MNRFAVPILLALLFSLQIIGLPLDALIFTDGVAGQYEYWILIATYACIVVAIFINRDKLASYNLDRLAFILLIVAGSVRVYAHVPNEAQYKNVILAIVIVILLMALVNWKKIPPTNFRWVLIGIVCCSLVVPLALIEGIQIEPYLNSNALYADHFSVYAVRNLLYNLSFVGPLEEITFRGILWGELRKWKVDENKIIWIQGIVFWFQHIWKIFTPITFFVSLPLTIILFSLLVRYSKQISASIICHILLNTLTPIGVYFFSK